MPESWSCLLMEQTCPCERCLNVIEYNSNSALYGHGNKTENIYFNKSRQMNW